VFLNKEWTFVTSIGEQLTYRLSHYEITTFGALKHTLRRLWEPTDDSPGLFNPTATERGIPFNW